MSYSERLQMSKMDPRYHRLYLRYLKEALKSDAEGKVIFKADCNNEYLGNPDEKGNTATTLWGIAPLMEGKVHVVDTDIVKIDKCRQMNHGVTYEVGDVRNLPYKDETFDLVLDFSTLDHIPFDDWQKALLEYRRVLKSDGETVVVAWTKGDYHIEGEGLVYYYNKYELDDMMRFCFDITDNKVMMDDGGELILWRGTKKDIPNKYPYLTGEDISKRFDFILENVDFTDKDIVDLNCGTANMAKRIPRCNSYTGNDNNPEYIARCPHDKGKFYLLDDSKLLKRLHRVDILMFLGYTVGGGGIESPTAEKSLEAIIEAKHPSVIVLEGTEQYFDVLEKQKYWEKKLSAYSLIQKSINFGDQPHLKRRVLIFKK